MAYRDNVQSLCDARGIPNPILEEDLLIAALVFYDEGHDFMFTVPATAMNRAGRLYVQSRFAASGTFALATQKGPAANFFTSEMWDDCGSDKRLLVYGFKIASLMKIVHK